MAGFQVPLLQAMTRCLLTAVLFAAAALGDDAHPGFPKPFFSWDTLPIAFHGANKERMYTSEEVQQLARYQMVTLEKWYTPCGDQHPVQAGPECDVESKMFETFRQIKAVNPKTTTIMYLNSMFNFAFYTLNGRLLEREAAGDRMLLRDKNGELVTLCNDGNHYCNITNFDWSVPEVFDIWLSTLVNATEIGGVDGVFADHGLDQHHQQNINLLPLTDPKLCNGNGDKRRCYEFTPEFAKQFNLGHDRMLNRTQDVLSNLTGGPVIDGPYANWRYNACNFTSLRAAIQRGRNGIGPRVIEANIGGCDPDETCLAAFLNAADEFTYMTCLNCCWPGPLIPLPTFHPEFAKPLGIPQSDAVEGPTGVWTRKFVSDAGTTIAVYDDNQHNGSVHWADDASVI